MLTSAGFNRRMRKTARPVVWKGCGVQLPAAPSNFALKSDCSSAFFATIGDAPVYFFF
jgi:hypothetical protein